MRKLLIIAIICTFCGCLLKTTCFAVSYATDVLEDTNPGGYYGSYKTFDQQYKVTPGEQFSVDIWIADVPAAGYMGGFWIEYDSSRLSIVAVEVYEGEPLIGPWDAGSTKIVPNINGPGTLKVIVAVFSGADPDTDGDIIIAKVTFERIGEDVNDAHITVDTSPCLSYLMWGLIPPWNDAMINEHTLTIYLDTDSDGVHEGEDNCPDTPNQNQTDSYPPRKNDCGDACECEGNFNPGVDDDVDGSDAAIFKADFGRGGYNDPCANGTPCNGDFNCDTDVDGTDAAAFKADFGRGGYNNPCPICPVTDPWCVYE